MQALARIPRAWFMALGETLLPLLLLLAGGLGLALTSQGAELAVMVSEDLSAWAFLGLATLAWSLMSWGWARQLLTDRFGAREDWARAGPRRAALLQALAYPREVSAATQARADALGTAVDWVPRLYALAPWGMAAGLAGFGQETWMPALALGAAGLAVALLLVLRRRLARRLIPQGGRGLAGRRALWWMTALLCLLAIGAFLQAPAALGARFGAVGSVFLALAVLLPFLALLGQRLRGAGLPALLALGLVFLLPALIEPDRHLVRSLPGDAPPGRLDLRAAARDWRDPAPGSGRPVVAVTTAGGGISAAVWTGLLLGSLQDAHPDFAERVFAISGVSGGALGAAVFAAAVGPQGGTPGARHLAEVEATCAALRPGWRGACVAGIAHRALAPDFLGPTVAAYGFGDTFGPLIGWTLPGRIPSRAEVLEEAWEAACRDAGCPAMAGPFHGLRDGLPWRPLLLLNGTHVQTGKRIVTSQMSVLPRDFTDALDFVALTGRELRLSTAALNAARFPYVTPAGRIRGRDGTALGHVVDGGYFENYGSETGAEVVRALREERPELPLVLIEISSDPALRPRDLGRYGAELDACKPDAELMDPIALTGAEGRDGLAPQALGPLSAMLHARSARGVQAASRVARGLVCDASAGPRPRVIQFALCAQDATGSRPPLGWSLSAGTRRAILGDVRALHAANGAPAPDACRAANHEAMQDLLRILQHDPIRPNQSDRMGVL